MPQLTKSRDPELGPLELLTGCHKDIEPFLAYLGIKSQHSLKRATLKITPDGVMLEAVVYVDFLVKGRCADGGIFSGSVFLEGQAGGDKMQKKFWKLRVPGDTSTKKLVTQNALLRKLGFDAFEAINKVVLNIDNNSIVTMEVEYTVRTTGGWDKVEPGFVVDDGIGER
jgi:hypothetical protein